MELKNLIRKTMAVRNRLIRTGQSRYNNAKMCAIIKEAKMRLDVGGSDDAIREYFRGRKNEIKSLMPPNWTKERAKLEELLS